MDIIKSYMPKKKAFGKYKGAEHKKEAASAALQHKKGAAGAAP